MSKITVKATVSDGLRQLRDNLRARTVDVLIDAMNEAHATAYRMAEYGEDDNNDTYEIHPPMIDEAGLSASLVMDGEDSLFLEYGAGDFTLPPQEAGSYSRSEKGSGKYDANGYWYYNRIQYFGIHPVRPIYYAGTTVKEYFEEHGHEVFEE